MSDLYKVAEKFNKILKKQAEEFESPDALDTWLSKTFSQAEKNKLVNSVAQKLAEKDIEISSLSTLIKVVDKKLNVVVTINGTVNPDASNMFRVAILGKNPDLNKFNGQTTPWIKYPK